MAKLFIWLGAVVGSFVGGAVPLLWGCSMLSASSILLSAIGAIAGVVAGYKFSELF